MNETELAVPKSEVAASSDNDVRQWMMSGTRVSCLMMFTNKEGFFLGKDATRYLREFQRATQVLRLNVGEMKREFESITDYTVQSRVEVIAKNGGGGVMFKMGDGK